MSFDDYRFRGGDDFVRLDSRCRELLGDFFGWLQSPEGGSLEPAAASTLAHAADRFVRDFLVDIMGRGPAEAGPPLPRQYLGNWYIINTLEPTHREVDVIRDALARLYRFLGARQLLGPDEAARAEGSLADAAFFHERLESFWKLHPDAITAWRAQDDYRSDRHKTPTRLG